MTMNITLIGAYTRSLVRFRGPLLQALRRAGYGVTAMASSSDSEAVDTLADWGVRFSPYPVQRNGLSPLADLQTWIALGRIFRQENPNIVLAYTIKPVIWGGLALWFVRKPRFYALITGLGFAFQPDAGRGWLTRLASLLYRLSLMRAEKVIFQNQDNLDEFVKRGIVPREKCVRVYGSGVDLAHYACTPVKQADPLFLGVGRLLGEKGLREFVQAAARVRRSHPQARFRWLGGYDPSPDGIPEAEHAHWQQAGDVDFIGEVADVRPHLAECQVFVLPSYHEGMPRSTLEALATGRPVLSTDVSGCRDTVIPGENGFLVPKADAEALAERMIWFIEHPERWQAMGQASRRIAEERFDVHRVNAEMLRIMGLA